jgi:hypothetical protein
MRISAIPVVLLYSSALVAQTVRVPFVGCPSEDQLGPREAPRGTDQEVHIKESAARRLSFYTSGGGFGVLAPRGWYCFARYGSSGGPLFVGPGAINSNDLFPVAGSAVELEATEGGGSGMYEVAQVLARVFPSQRPFVQGVINSDVEPASDFTFAPYPNDKLIVQTARLVQFQTPPHSEGLGTMSRLKSNDDPIDGFAMLEGKTPDLLMLRVRLPREQRDLAPVIIQDLLLRQRRDPR